MAHEFNGTDYAKASSHQREWGARLIAELALKGTERILDLGCGDGALTVRLAELVPRGGVVGVDASRGMIDAALATTAPENVRFLLLDINDLRLDDVFDVAFSNAALHWVKDHRGMLARVRSVLRPGGAVRFQFAGAGNCASFLKVVREAMAAGEFSAAFSDFPWPWYMPTVEEYEAIVGSAGFSDARVWGENADRHFPDQEALVRWIDQPSLVPFLEHLPAHQKGAFRARVADRMIEETRQPDGRCFETFRRVNAWARK